MHYVITLEYPGVVSTTDHGTLRLPVGVTRAQVFEQVRHKHGEDLRQRMGQTRHPTVLFWSLEPNTIVVPA
jgi:hypothetical protein